MYYDKCKNIHKEGAKVHIFFTHVEAPVLNVLIQLLNSSKGEKVQALKCTYNMTQR